ncbi:phosphate ABC transporter substrate-binding protein PstS [Janibacter hoylei]|uniref:phosphate ABC transporter substrate-binding protein PstS n=1 Tax=Janibacter hoylei TaxID=364298 RepID=UPI0021A2A932|nr:phosphate ABC transporter substrate-binding protein PstS [Janibacter hoylei]MCT1617837.1 phosphate ABC transporter substrate-binding protein PstS [Janibacter hoylei]MCT2293814.1 phosphate ABC transporter substrate-binding protein PstS [Janibacter hoylei]MCW4602026.1 phosphate ABC transporter substrate-binding protein PstS [Janibacter hoylei]
MIRSTRGRKVLTTSAALALTFTMAACGAGNEGETSASGGDGDAAASASGTIKGAGASSMEKAQNEWIANFTDVAPDATVEYAPDGSGTGREKFINGAVNFAGTDSAMDDDEIAKAKEKGCTGETIQFPIYVSPIAVAFNLKDVDSLNLSAPVIADIFSGKIKTWNDPAIAKENEGVDLPDTKITPVNRSDESGTSKNFSAYLSEAAPENWKHEPEDVWPIKGGEAAKGTSGVVDTIGAGEGNIGYADASQIGDLKAAKIKAGEEFIEYSPDAAAKILESAERVDESSKTNYAVKLDRGNAGEGVYPVVLVSYAVACTDYEDKDVASTVKAYLEYAVSEDGQKASTDAAGSAGLSEAATKNATDALGQIKTD